MSSPLDPFTFEVLRHRLWTMTEEATTVLRLVSGSPVAAEATDCNAALMTGGGEAVMIGAGLAGHAFSCINTVQYVLREYQENPGIGPDDMFISNDPYRATPHQACVVLVAPVHWDNQLVAWTGAGIHLIDVGGPVPGQASVGAQSIFQEPTPMPPLRIVEGGRIRKDIEDEYLIRSRTRQLNALDLKAKIAANGTLKQRLYQTIRSYGPSTVTEAMQRTIAYTEATLRARLRDLPDGIWRDQVYLDYNDRGVTTYYACGLTMTKTGDRLAFDFSGASAQAPAVVNCSYTTLVSSVVNALLTLLCYGLPWCPAAVLRLIEVTVEPGTFVSAVWPAGMSKSTSAASQTVRQAVNLCVSRMFAASDLCVPRALAICQGYNAVQELAGTDQRGEPFGVPIIDVSLSGGYGARGDRDGINTGGSLGSPHVSIANVETYEFRYPLLFLFRQQQPDTGGPGKHRGGVGLSAMFMPHDVPKIPTNIMHTLGFSYPSARGLCGGYPGSTNQYILKRNSNILAYFERGRMPRGFDEIEGTVEVPPGMSISYLDAPDVYLCINSGGGGYGDPLERDPRLVLEDVKNKLVSVEWARKTYGVAVDQEQANVDGPATELCRNGIRLDRQRRAQKIGEGRSDQSRVDVEALLPTSLRLTECLRVALLPAGPVVYCRCGTVVGDGRANYKLGLRLIEEPCRKAGPHTMDLIEAPQFVLKEYVCPGCLALVEVEVAPPDHPVEAEVTLSF